VLGKTGCRYTSYNFTHLAFQSQSSFQDLGGCCYMTEKKKVLLGIKIDEGTYLQICESAKKAGKPKSTFARDIISDYFKITKTRTFSELKNKLERIIPDFEDQQKWFSLMMSKLDTYTDSNNEVHKYISEQKSAESYYFREINDRVDEIAKSNKHLESALVALLEAMSSDKTPSRNNKSDDIYNKLFKK